MTVHGPDVRAFRNQRNSKIFVFQRPQRNFFLSVVADSYRNDSDPTVCVSTAIQKRRDLRAHRVVNGYREYDAIQARNSALPLNCWCSRTCEQDKPHIFQRHTHCPPHGPDQLSPRHDVLSLLYLISGVLLHLHSGGTDASTALFF